MTTTKGRNKRIIIWERIFLALKLVVVVSKSKILQFSLSDYAVREGGCAVTEMIR